VGSKTQTSQVRDVPLSGPNTKQPTASRNQERWPCNGLENKLLCGRACSSLTLPPASRASLTPQPTYPLMSCGGTNRTAWAWIRRRQLGRCFWDLDKRSGRHSSGLQVVLAHGRERRKVLRAPTIRRSLIAPTKSSHHPAPRTATTPERQPTRRGELKEPRPHPSLRAPSPNRIRLGPRLCVSAMAD
jgi:hypothetical protein